MTIQELYTKLHTDFLQIIHQHNLEEANIHIKSKGLSPEEAIGKTSRLDYPILAGKEIMLQAEFEGAIGQAFTSAPSDFSGTLKDILVMDIINDTYARGLFIATLNAVLCKLGYINHTVHCKNEEPEECSKHYLHFIQKEHYQKVLIIGFQPAFVAHLAQKCDLRVLDLNPEVVGKNKSGVLIEHGDIWQEATQWADIVLCTSSTICNGSFVQFIDLHNVLFFGTSGAGAVKLLNLKRLCPMSC